jgi:4-amino-4-deoxy-L-arabinose transferase-like glycosyltransferase
VSVTNGTSQAVGIAGTTEATELQRDAGPARASQKTLLRSADTRFWLGVVGAVVLGATIRFSYLFHGAPAWVLGDGFDYHIRAHRLADGLGYTSGLGGVGAEYAHHPPAWVTVLGGVTELGGRTMRAHQVTGVVIGLAVILVVGLVGRRYAGRRVGVIAAFLAALYPGFWVIDVQILSEPLGLLVLGLVMLVLAGLWRRPTLAASILAGAGVGALALVRGEQLALLAIAVAPILLLNPRVAVRQRLAWTCTAALAGAAVIAPWAVYNLGRFEEPVVLSTNGGSTLLAGNCPPATYSGELIGSFAPCSQLYAIAAGGGDASQVDVEAHKVALDNMRDNLGRLPATVLARYGRTIGVFRPAQTVDIDASWFGSASWPVWAWITSFWLLLPLAVCGSVLLRQARRFQWPLVAPAVIVLVVVTLAFGDPRYHTLADLGVVVLSAVAVDRLVRRRAHPA